MTRLHCNQLNNHIIITGDTFAHCSLCCSDFGVSHGGKHDVYVHVNGKRHKEAASAASSTCSVTSFFKPQHISRVTEARWALFTAKHNLSFQKKTVTNLSNPFSVLVDASLSHETLVHLFSIKFNDTSCCFDTELSEELIAKCKKATLLEQEVEYNFHLTRTCINKL